MLQQNKKKKDLPKKTVGEGSVFGTQADGFFKCHEIV